jgi:hypothetical protein
MPVRPVRPVTPVKPGIIPGTIPKASVGLGGVWANKYVGDIYFIIYIYIFISVAWCSYIPRVYYNIL